ncbi:threonine dehydratase biosynthetic protein [Tanacetum coccineum]
MATISFPCHLPSLTPDNNKTTKKTILALSFRVAALSTSSTNSYTAKDAISVMANPQKTLPQFSPDSLQYEQGKVGAVPDGRVCESSVGAMWYLTSILTSKVYDVAVESPLQHAAKLSERLGVDIWLKREDLLPNVYRKVNLVPPTRF